ncbi:MAG: kynureninase [Bacteroidia bacterium]|jgi:kynureninase|nr:kynureninase [Bacteroidia bacterium]
MIFEHNRGFAQRLDEDDSLRDFRQLFHFPTQKNGSDFLYFCGNSLGLQPRTAKQALDSELEDWANLGVEGHFHGKKPWFHYHKFLTEHSAELVGGRHHEVVIMNQLTVNLHLLMVSFYKPTKTRFKIIMEAGAFPSDMYAIESQVKFHGYDYDEAVIEIEPREGEHTLRTEDILQTIEENGEQTALVFFAGVQYYTGQFFEIEKITAAAHSVGAIAGWDLAHTAGNLPLKLHDWKVDFAAWCSYKYLNSGPGNVSGVFVHEKHGLDENTHRFAGWWGHKESERFQMKRGYIPEPGAAGWQMSNAPVFGMAVHLSSLEIFHKAGMENIRAKSKMLTAYLQETLKYVQNNNPALDFNVITPENPEHRGAQLSILVKENGKALFDYITENGVIADWREPNVIRLAPAALYNSFTDIYELGETMKGFTI